MNDTTDLDPVGMVIEAARKTSVGVNIPRLVIADDYHDLAFMQDNLHECGFPENVVISEIGFEDMQYVGLVYDKTNAEHIELKATLEAYYQDDVL
jgi:hypothetical protein